MKRALLVSFLSSILAGCNCGTKVGTPCNGSADCGVGLTCTMGKCVAGSGGGAGGSSGTGGGGAGVGGGSGGGMGTGGGGGIVTGCDPTASDNATRDTDCDGLSDLEEYNTLYANSAHTDPCNTDTDGDGIPDGVEMGRTTTVNNTCGAKFVPDQDPITRSDPTNVDSDGDGIKDGEEDKNKDGKLDPGECSPIRKDTDCDGISDKDELMGTLGCMTDCQKLDTDGDGLPDGVEQGLQAPGADPAICKYTASAFDTDAATKTQACTADTDGDGIQDGAEDGNHNGKVDPGELDPNLATDGTGPAQQACATANLKPIVVQSSGLADVEVALVPAYSEISKLNNGTENGIAFYNPTTHIGGLVLSKMPAGADATAEETFGRGKLNGTGAITGPITQTFTTWDGFAASVRGTYNNGGAADVKTRVNDIAKAYLGTNTMGLLQGAGGVTGPFTIQAEYVRRTANRAIVLIAVVPTAAYTGQNVFELDDTAGGSALAQFGDYTATTCEVFLSDINAKVDFLWAVDDSGSMGGYQAAIGNAASLFSTQLAAAGLDWRAGAVTTGYYSGNCTPGTSPLCYRPFTATAATMISWFSSGGGAANWFGTSGDSDERSLQSSQGYIATLLPKTNVATDNKVRNGAALHVILLGDADDQGTAAITGVEAFYNNFDNAGSKAVVHGIVCPQGQTCNETQENPRRNLAVIAATGGILGDINVAQNNSPQLAQTITAILASAINGTGHQLLKPPISATIKVAIETGGTKGTCNVNDIPRDRTNGFDFDSSSRRIVFFGNCIPNAAGKKVAVSYRYWIDATPDPNGDPCGGACSGGKVCDPSTKACVCPVNCGGACMAGTICDMNSCTCGPGIN